MKVLVFGAGGYIGIPLCEELASRGHEVTGADRFFFGKRPKCDCITADIRTFQFITVDILSLEFKSSSYDAVIDLCGLSNDASCDIDPELTYAINLKGAKQLAKRAKDAGIRRYIYASSAAVYGHGDKMGLTENDVCKPLTHYAECKVQVEDYLRKIAGGGFEPVILRNATVFGVAPRMRFDLAVNGMTLRAIREHVIYVMGGGEQWRPFVHVNDVVKVFAGMLTAEGVAGETFNVGANHMNLRISDLSKIVQDHCPYAKPHQIPDDIDRRSYHLSFAKLNKVLPKGWAKVVDGVREVGRALELDPHLATDPTTMTVAYYKSLIGWENRLSGLRMDGKILS
jgi:nucleoside-diphosphate-sugar epimerase